jgi:hypothetical protein
MPAMGGITPASMDRLLASPSRASATIAAIVIAAIGTTATNIAVAIELRRRRGILRQRLTRSRAQDRAPAVEDIAVGPPPPEAPVTAAMGPAAISRVAATEDKERRP